MKMQKKINGLYVTAKGKPENQSIVFVHGFPYDHTMWNFQIEELSKKYYCVSYDVRGLGKSYVGDGQYTMEAFVWDLFSVIEGMKLEKPVLCGLSMGGYISLRAVEVDQNRFKALILCDTRSQADDNEGKLKRALAINQINTEGLAAFAEPFVTNCFWNQTVKKKAGLFNEVLRNSLKHNPVGVKGGLIAMLSRTDTTKALKKFKLPTLVLVGKHDALTPPEVMQKMAKKIKKSDFFVVPKAGHMAPLENPDFVNTKIIKFLEKLEG